MTVLLRGRARVVLDTDMLLDYGDRARLLLGLLRRDELELVRYADDGPPAIEIRTDLELGVKVCPGWLIFEPSIPATWDHLGRVTYTTSTGGWSSNVVSGGEVLLDARLASMAEHLCTEVQQSRHDLTVLLIAKAADAHLLITDRPVLLAQPPFAGYSAATRVSGVEDALAAVGELLRARGVYLVNASPEGGQSEVDRHSYYLIAVQNLLHEGWRWSHGCTQSGDLVLHDLSLSLYRRLGTALKARDRARTAGLVMERSAALDEVLECVDVVALNVMAAFDVVARVANQILAITPRNRNASWTRSAWTDKLPRPGLGTVYDTQAQVVTLVSTLRNTIHERAMHLGRLDNDDDGYYVVLPEDEYQTLLPAFTELGGLRAWGVRNIGEGHLWADPFQLIEQMLRTGTRALNHLQAGTPLEQVAPGVTLRSEPPAAARPGKTYRRHVAWQMGLPDDGGQPNCP